MLTVAVVALCATIDASHFAGTLTEPDLSEVPVQQLTPEQLLTEQKRLEAYRTEFIGPVVLTAVGGVVVIVAAVFAVAGTLMAVVPALAKAMATTLQIVGYVFMGLSGAALIAGGIVLTVGLVKLFPTLARRHEAMERRDEIQRRLDAQDPGKQPSGPPSKSKPSPNDVLWQGPEAGMLLLTF